MNSSSSVFSWLKQQAVDFWDVVKEAHPVIVGIFVYSFLAICLIVFILCRRSSSSSSGDLLYELGESSSSGRQYPGIDELTSINEMFAQLKIDSDPPAEQQLWAIDETPELDIDPETSTRRSIHQRCIQQQLAILKTSPLRSGEYPSTSHRPASSAVTSQMTELRRVQIYRNLSVRKKRGKKNSSRTPFRLTGTGSIENAEEEQQSANSSHPSISRLLQEPISHPDTRTNRPFSRKKSI